MKRSLDRINVMVTGAGSLLGQGIINSIKQSSIPSVRIIGTDYLSTAVGLYWADKSYILPDLLDESVLTEQWIDALVEIIISEKISIVFIGLDFELPVIAENKALIERRTNAAIVVSDSELINIATDKWETVQYLNRLGFDCPKSTLPDGLDSFFEKERFPVIVKPRTGSTSKNVFLVNNKEEMDVALSKCDKPIVQEYLPGNDNEFTCGAIYLNDKIITLICLRRVLKHGNTYIAFSEDTPIIDKFVKALTNSIKPFGPINFQLKLTKRGPIVFEINCRLSGTTPIRADFGINEVEIIIRVLKGLALKTKLVKRPGVILRYYKHQFLTFEEFGKF